MPEPRLHLDADTSSKALQTALIAALDRLLSEPQADDWIGQVRWLNQWQVSNKGEGEYVPWKA